MGQGGQDELWEAGETQIPCASGRSPGHCRLFQRSKGSCKHCKLRSPLSDGEKEPGVSLRRVNRWQRGQKVELRAAEGPGLLRSLGVTLSGSRRSGGSAEGQAWPFLNGTLGTPSVENMWPSASLGRVAAMGSLIRRLPS